MRNLRSYYSASIADFLRQSYREILGIIHANDISAETTIQQSNTWESEISILKDQLRAFSDGRIIFEYTIPRMGKRVDTVVLYRNIVFLWSLKSGTVNTARARMARCTTTHWICETSRKKAMTSCWCRS